MLLFQHVAEKYINLSKRQIDPQPPSVSFYNNIIVL